MAASENASQHPSPPSLHEAGMVVNWAETLEAHRDSLRGLVASKLGEAEQAVTDDILQEVAIAAHAARDGTVAPDRAGAWLRSVATHKVQDHWRRVQRQRRLHRQLQDEGAPDSNPGASLYEWVVDLDRRESVADAMAQLDDEDRAILQKKYVHGHSCREIASTLGLTIKAAEYRLDKARKAIRHLLSKSNSSKP